MKGGVVTILPHSIACSAPAWKSLQTRTAWFQGRGLDVFAGVVAASFGRTTRAQSAVHDGVNLQSSTMINHRPGVIVTLAGYMMCMGGNSVTAIGRWALGYDLYCNAPSRGGSPLGRLQLLWHEAGDRSRCFGLPVTDNSCGWTLISQPIMVTCIRVTTVRLSCEHSYRNGPP